MHSVLLRILYYCAFCIIAYFTILVDQTALHLVDVIPHSFILRFALHMVYTELLQNLYYCVFYDTGGLHNPETLWM